MYPEKSSPTPNNEPAQMQDAAKKESDYLWVWGCHNCGLQASMSVKFNEHCVDCGHHRCSYCDLEHREKAADFADCSEISSLIADQFDHPKEREIVSSKPSSGAPNKSRGKKTDRSNNDIENARNNRRPKEQKADKEGNPARLFACPFQKIDPMNHGLSVVAERQLKYRACICPGFVIHRLVQHLHEVHRDYDLVKSIKQSIKGKAYFTFGSEEEREQAKWLVIWKTLFPGVAAPKSPYNDRVYPQRDPEELISTFGLSFELMLKQESLRREQAHRIYIIASLALRKALQIETDCLRHHGDSGRSPLEFEKSKNEPQDCFGISSTFPPSDEPASISRHSQISLPEMYLTHCYSVTEPMVGPAIAACTPTTGQTYAAAYQPEPAIFSNHSWTSIAPTPFTFSAPDTDLMSSWTNFSSAALPTANIFDPDPNLYSDWGTQLTSIPALPQRHDPSIIFSCPNLDQEHTSIPEFLPGINNPPDSMEQLMHPNQYDLDAFFSSEINADISEMPIFNPASTEPLVAPSSDSEIDITHVFLGDVDTDTLPAIFGFEGECTGWMAQLKNSYNRNRHLQGGNYDIQP